MERKGLRILAIDDNPDNLITLKAVMADAFPHTQVLTAQDGKRGIELAIAEHPQVILLDIVMPGMDGFAVCRVIKNDVRLKHIPVVFLTALKTDRTNRSQALEAGAEGFLTKPIDEIELLAVIRVMAKIHAASDRQEHETERLAALVYERTQELEQELEERRRIEQELRQANLQLKQNQVTMLNLLEDLKAEVAARRKSEESLRNTTAELETLIQVSPLAITMLDREGRIQLWNGSAERVFGWRADEILGQPNPIVPAGKAEEYAMLSKKILLGQPITSQETVRQRKDGSLIHVSISSAALYDAAGNITGRMSIVADISESKLAEEALQQSEERFRGLFSNSIDGVALHEIVLDEQGKPVDYIYLMANHGFEIHTGLQVADILGKRVTQIHPGIENSGLVEIYGKVALTGEPISFETYFEPLARFFNISTYQVGYGRFAVVFEDITDRKQRETELQAIASLSAAMRAAPTRAEILPVVVDQLVTLLKCDTISIEIIDPLTGDAVTELAYGVWKVLIGQRQKSGTGINVMISQTRQPYYTNNLSSALSFAHPELIQKDICAALAVPLIAQDNLIGFVWIGRRTEIANSDVRLLSAVADITANAIYRATLHEQTRKDAAELARAYDITLEGWARALELRDQETEGHTRRVVQMATDLARAMGFSENELEHVRRGALLHDIGKMGIPDSVLLKPGSLSDCEWKVMKRHPEYAHQLLARIDYLRPALDIPYCHHEKWDGTGYPRGLAGEAIPVAARIFAIVDVWDALCSDRPYRLAWTKSQATAYLQDQAGKHFDPHVVEKFLTMPPRYTPTTP